MSEKPRNRAKAPNGAASNKQPSSQVAAGPVKPAFAATQAPDPTTAALTKKKKRCTRAQQNSPHSSFATLLIQSFF